MASIMKELWVIEPVETVLFLFLLMLNLILWNIDHLPDPVFFGKTEKEKYS